VVPTGVQATRPRLTRPLYYQREAAHKGKLAARHRFLGRAPVLSALACFRLWRAASHCLPVFSRARAVPSAGRRLKTVHSRRAL